jgi:hypothetical protein
LDGRGYAGLRGAGAATSLKRSPMPSGIGCAPLARSGSRPHPRKSRVPDETSGLETAVIVAAKQRRSSVGAAFRAIPATAEQFQIGARPPLKLINRDSDLVRLAAVNCGFSDETSGLPRQAQHRRRAHAVAEASRSPVFGKRSGDSIWRDQPTRVVLALKAPSSVVEPAGGDLRR